MSGLTSVKTLKVHREEGNQKAKDLATTLFVPRPSVEKVRTLGKFHGVTPPSNSDQFLADRHLLFSVNPHYVEQLRRKDDFEFKMLEKKHK
jgi:hypothetical protein